MEHTMNVVAIPLFGKRVSARLDCTEEILLVSFHQGRETKREVIRCPEHHPVDRVQQLIIRGVRTLICGGVSERCARLLHGTPIEIIPWVQGDAEDVLQRYLAGEFRQESQQEGGRSCNPLINAFTEHLMR
jgi:predicted Fe-Mo cluster-binding NifX family protein